MQKEGKQYIQLIAVSAIPNGKAISIHDESVGDVAIFHHNGEYYVTSNICPHHHAAVLAQGFVEDGTVTCPLHGYEYELRSGTCLTGGADIKTFTPLIYEGYLYIEEIEQSQPKWMMNF